jgi:hypothetical protein
MQSSLTDLGSESLQSALVAAGGADFGPLAREHLCDRQTDTCTNSPAGVN